MFDPNRFRSLRQERALALGEPLAWSEVTGSTNDDAMLALRRGAPHGTTFVAGHQSAGRGRRGRRWQVPPGEGLLFSVIVRPRLLLDRTALLALASGLCVRSVLAKRLPALEAQNAVRVKWPNDVWLSDKKVAGVLAESQIEGGAVRGAVIGVGINLLTREFSEELAPHATSLALAGAACEPEALLADVLSELAAKLSALECGQTEPLLTELARYDALRGRPIRVDDQRGIAAGIDETGALLIRNAAGVVVSVASGSVELDV